MLALRASLIDKNGGERGITRHARPSGRLRYASTFQYATAYWSNPPYLFHRGFESNHHCLQVIKESAPLVNNLMAEREGFEPSIRINVYTLSRRAPSATRPPLHIFRLYAFTALSPGENTDTTGTLTNAMAYATVSAAAILPEEH